MMVANIQNWLPCTLAQSDNYSPITGVEFDSAGLTVTYRINGSATVTKALTLADWSEGVEGGYAIRFSPLEYSDVGRLDYWVAYPGSVPYSGSEEITGVSTTINAYTPSEAMVALQLALSTEGLVDGNYIILDEYQRVEAHVFESMFGAALLDEVDVYAALLSADDNGDGTHKGYSRFFEAWHTAGVA